MVKHTLLLSAILVITQVFRLTCCSHDVVIRALGPFSEPVTLATAVNYML